MKGLMNLCTSIRSKVNYEQAFYTNLQILTIH